VECETRRTRSRPRAGAEDSLADEPSSGLDRITASRNRRIAVEAKGRAQDNFDRPSRTMCAAQHALGIVAGSGPGKLIADGTPAEIEHSENEIARKLMSE